MAEARAPRLSACQPAAREEVPGIRVLSFPLQAPSHTTSMWEMAGPVVLAAPPAPLGPTAGTPKLLTLRPRSWSSQAVVRAVAIWEVVVAEVSAAPESIRSDVRARLVVLVLRYPPSIPRSGSLWVGIALPALLRDLGFSPKRDSEERAGE